MLWNSIDYFRTISYKLVYGKVVTITTTDLHICFTLGWVPERLSRAQLIGIAGAEFFYVPGVFFVTEQ